jgi:hypothetical protein
MGNEDNTRFGKLRRRLIFVAIAGPCLWMAAVASWAWNLGLTPWFCAALAIASSQILPLEEMRKNRAAARRWTQVDTVVDIFRAASLIALFFWLQSMPEFWTFEERLVNRTLWDWRPYTAIALWTIIAAYRNCAYLSAISDRQIFRYYRGEEEEISAGQTFSKIDIEKL